jgi:hypothetical protein
MVTVPPVVGAHVMVYVVPAGTASWRPGLAIGLQALVHWVVGWVYASTTAAEAAKTVKYFANILVNNG